MSNSSCHSGNRLTNIFGDVESAFKHFFDHSEKARFAPNWDVVERPEGFNVVVELPGVSLEDVNVQIEDGVLTISGEKKVDRTEEQSTFHRVERVNGSFKRTLEFSVPVDMENIEASFDNGLLEVSIPKSEKALPRKIDVKIKND